MWWEVRADVGRGSDGRLKRIAGLALEITSRKLAEDSLRDAADTDPLTGALNRRGLEAVADRCIAATEEPETLHLLALDIDHFKAVNDTYGHPAGDVALRAVADRVAAHLREGDWLARVGGEEFAVLLHGGPRVAEVVAERIRVGVAAEPVDCLEAGGPLGGLTLTVSLGVATFIPGETLHAALRRADAALYAAKRGGRNRVVRAEDLAHVGAA